MTVTRLKLHTKFDQIVKVRAGANKFQAKVKYRVMKRLTYDMSFHMHLSATAAEGMTLMSASI